MASRAMALLLRRLPRGSSRGRTSTSTALPGRDPEVDCGPPGCQGGPLCKSLQTEKQLIRSLPAAVDVFRTRGRHGFHPGRELRSQGVNATTCYVSLLVTTGQSQAGSLHAG